MPHMDPQITAVLDFWFAERPRSEPTVDARMTCWFGHDPAFDAALTERFGPLADAALAGRHDAWAAEPAGRLALILLLGEFPRHVHRHSKQAYRGDRKALRLCEQGVAESVYRELDDLQQLFFFMPLQRIEAPKVQATSVKVYSALARRCPAPLRDTFETVAQFAELRRDIVAEFGRFPHRDAILGRERPAGESLTLEA